MIRSRNTRQSERLSRLPAAFTIIELLVVIGVLTLLVTLVVATGSHLIEQQKRRNTQQIMQNLTLAVDIFAKDDPLHNFYNRKDAVSFGPYPPYQLRKGLNPAPTDVAWLFEYNPPAPPPSLGQLGFSTVQNKLSDRVARDLGCRLDLGESINNYITIFDESAGSPDDDNYAGDALTDARAFFTYMKLFSPEALKLIPEEYVKTPYLNRPRLQQDYVNPKNTGTNPDNPNARPTLENMLVVHDAWGVPIDYMLYVKAELQVAVPRPSFINPLDPSLRFVTAERRPVFRSLGIQRELYDTALRIEPLPARRIYDPDKWLFSEALPRPYAGLLGSKQDTFPDPSAGSSVKGDVNGWLRMVGVGEDYGYLPEEVKR